MAGGLLGIATSGLLASRRQLETTGHNVSNLNTEGYSRQRVELTERPANFTGGTYVGNGVNIASVTRAYDGFLNAQVRTSLSQYHQQDAFHEMATKVDNFIADSDAALTPQLQKFFKAAQGVANDPTSIAARQVMLSETDGLARRFNSLNKQLSDLRDQSSQRIPTVTSEINEMAKGIAELNTQITTALGASQGNPPNDLLDQRNLLIEKVSEKIDTQLVPEKDGAINVFIGSGQPLVLKSLAARLEMRSSPYGGTQDPEFALVVDQRETIVTQSIRGGELGGLVQLNKELIDPVQNGLGRLAAAMAVTVNAQSQAGTDLQGNAGVNMFTDPTASGTLRQAWSAHSQNLGNATLAVNLTNTPASGATPANGPAQLTDSDYRLSYDGSQFKLTRLSDNTQFTSATGTFAQDGFSLAIASGSVSAGDNFMIRPARSFAGDIQAKLTDPRQIAAAGTPSKGVGDNTNALAMGNLQTKQVLFGGKASFQDAYTELVGKVGAATRSAELSSTAQKKLLDNAIQSRDSLSGVNLDEEAANLLRFQQAYQASAQLVPAFRSMFDALISAVRG